MSSIPRKASGRTSVPVKGRDEPVFDPGVGSVVPVNGSAPGWAVVDVVLELDAADEGMVEVVDEDGEVGTVVDVVDEDGLVGMVVVVVEVLVLVVVDVEVDVVVVVQSPSCTDCLWPNMKRHGGGPRSASAWSTPQKLAG
jgi:hypothetical protein